MRNICKVCTLLKVCMTECKESKVYDIGYNDAIVKAWQWHKSHKDGVNDFEDFIKAMKDETDY